MNRLFITSLAFITAACALASDRNGEISRYFSGASSTDYRSRVKYGSREEADRAAAEVWDTWRAAQKKSMDGPLLPLRPLDGRSIGGWPLPAALEPDAEMRYFWGSKGEKPSEGYPLFLYLHGSGPRNQEWWTGLKLAQLFDDSPSAYFIPRIPNEGQYYRWWQRAKQYAWGRLLKQALASGEIDPDHVYMFGISEGGYGSQRLGSFYADYLAGAGPMAGGEPLANAPAENLRNTSFILRTGADDYGFYRNKLTAYTARAIDSLQHLHPDAYRATVELIPGAEHHIDYRPTTPWLRQYARNPYPRHISWENFEMDSIYRDCFYNIRVDRRSNPDFNSRSYYELDIDNNTVDLRVDLVEYTVTELDSIWQIPLDFAKRHTPATTGRVTVYLNDELVDLDRPVTFNVNGRCVYEGRLPRRLDNLVNSCRTYFDPRRLYPAALTVDLSELN